MKKVNVLFFARSFLTKYYSDIESDIIEPIFATLTLQEKIFLINKGHKVYGCFEEEFYNLPIAEFSDNYLRTSLASDRFLFRFPYSRRLEILGKEISFWRNIITKHKPVLLVNETVALEISEVLAIEAERMNIPYYSALLGFLPNTMYWKPDPFSGRLNDLSIIVPKDIEITLAKEYIKNVVEENQHPFYVKFLSNNCFLSIKIFLSTLIADIIIYLKERLRNSINSSFKYEDYSIFCFRYQKTFLRKVFYNYYDNLDSLSGKKYLFFPLHMEPEATLNYFVDENYSQFSIVECIIKSLKARQYLVVKEHPQHNGMLVQKKYRELKKQYKNLLFIQAHIPSFEIIKNSQAIVTLTSTVAWEGLLAGHPAFVLGKIFYDQCPGAIRIDNLKELKEKIRADSYSIPDKEEVTLFAARMISIFHAGCPTPLMKDTKVSDYLKSLEKLICDNIN